MATLKACRILFQRLTAFAATHLGDDASACESYTIVDGVVHKGGEPTELGWNKLVAAAQWARVDLSCHEFYATPNVYHDATVERGRPFAYYSFGTALTKVRLDCLWGTYEILSVDIVHDVGRSLSETIDRGQIEGALVQGIGWATMEQLRYGTDGRVLTGVNAYKIPDIKFGPHSLTIQLLEDVGNPYAVCNSKAIGEPPFLYGLGAYFALLHAMRSVRRDKALPPMPLTPEQVLTFLHG
jgi:xanthine dehydrogenase large subunit